LEKAKYHIWKAYFKHAFENMWKRLNTYLIILMLEILQYLSYLNLNNNTMELI